MATNHFLILGTHLSFFTPRGRVYLPPPWICISINWFWLTECNRKDAAAQGARTLTPFTFLFLGTQTPYCEKLISHKDSTWRRTEVLWLTGPAGLLDNCQGDFPSWKELSQSCSQITAALVMSMGNRRTYQSSHRIMRLNEVVVNTHHRALAYFSSSENICFVTLVQPLDLPSTLISWFVQWGKKLVLTSYGGSDSMRQWRRIPSSVPGIW